MQVTLQHQDLENFLLLGSIGKLLTPHVQHGCMPIEHVAGHGREELMPYACFLT